MTATSVLAGLNEEATQLELLGNISFLLNEILANTPRLDGQKRAITTTEAAQAVTVSSGTVTTVADVTRVNAYGSSATSKPSDAIPMHMANAGVMHIYNNITVS